MPSLFTRSAGKRLYSGTFAPGPLVPGLTIDVSQFRKITVAAAAAQGPGVMNGALVTLKPDGTPYVAGDNPGSNEPWINPWDLSQDQTFIFSTPSSRVILTTMCEHMSVIKFELFNSSAGNIDVTIDMWATAAGFFNRQ